MGLVSKIQLVKVNEYNKSKDWNWTYLLECLSALRLKVLSESVHLGNRLFILTLIFTLFYLPSVTIFIKQGYVFHSNFEYFTLLIIQYQNVGSKFVASCTVWILKQTVVFGRPRGGRGLRVRGRDVTVACPHATAHSVSQLNYF